MRLLFASALVLMGPAACNPTAPRVEDERIVVLEKQNRGLEERLSHLERDLVEVRALIAQESDARAAGDAKLTAAAASAAVPHVAPSGGAQRTPTSPLHAGLRDPGF